ncbi:preprotein translocase subunit YajC [Brackiella oedipodis]|uniref:preprotein translocase subunit YajC n=1 Tax=Brackiella oedipodis TaxID=124225 RepID=UPI00048BB2D8|nr:preprotein translocase subunit YajC [Brackiella oedipodis]
MSLHPLFSSVIAQAQSQQAGFLSFLPIIIMFVALYFFMIRPQMKRQKEHKAMVEALGIGDEVVINGGILGRIAKVSENYIHVDISRKFDQPIEIIVQRSAVNSVLPKNTIKSL